MQLLGLLFGLQSWISQKSLLLHLCQVLWLVKWFTLLPGAWHSVLPAFCRELLLPFCPSERVSEDMVWTLCAPLLWREPALLLLPCSGASTKEEMCARNRSGCRYLFKQTVCWNQFFILNQLGGQGSSPVLEKPWPFRAEVTMLIFWECELTIFKSLKLGES